MKTSRRELPLAVRIGGELIVIVVGVLIALWVDNLNEDRREGLREQAYLNGVLVDLRSDSTELDDRRTTALRGLEVADRLLELRRDPTLTASADSLAEWFFRAAFVDNFQVLDHTYREILGAGGLSLIRDETLRRRISDYYRSIESADFFTEYYKDEESAYWDLLGARLDPDDFERISRSDESVGAMVPSRLIEQLRRDDELANAILMNRHWTALRLDINGRRIVGNRELTAALRTHLGG